MRSLSFLFANEMAVERRSDAALPVRLHPLVPAGRYRALLSRLDFSYFLYRYFIEATVEDLFSMWKEAA